METSTAAERVAWIDVARGVGIICVVTAHILVDPAISWPLGRFIYLFHMPFFFMLSGLLQRPAPIGDTLRRRAGALLRPYLFFLILLSLPLLRVDLSHVLHHQRIGTAEIYDLVFGGQRLTGDFGVFWFVTCLFFAQLAFAALRQRFGVLDPKMIAIVLALGLVGYGLAAENIVLPWALGIAPMAVAFLWLGAVVGEVGISPRRTVGAAGVALALILTVTIVTGRAPSFDMKAYDYGWPVLGVLLAASMSLGIFGICKMLAAVSVIRLPLTELGRASLVIMFLHQFIHIRAAHFIGQPVILILVSLGIPTMIYFAIPAWPALRYLALGERWQRRAAAIAQ